MKKLTVWLFLFFTFFGFYFMSKKSWAIPNFARKYDVECSLCHTVVPKLTPTGFRFRSAGFRMPDELNEKQKGDFKLGDYFSARIQVREDVKQTKEGDSSQTSNQLTFHEFTFYPLAGAFAKHFSSLVEMSFASEETAEIENAYLRVNWGKPESYFSVRGGIFHPFEGFGASDRPMSLSRPLFQTNQAIYDQNTYFKIWGFDQAGIELGYSYKDSYFRLAAFNGINSEGEPAQGGDLQKSDDSPSYNNKDIQFTFTQLLGDSGAGFGAYLYHGSIDLPIGNSNMLWKNTFNRFALYANYEVNEKLNFLAGYAGGNDHKYDLLSNTLSNDTFSNNGYFVEGDYIFNEFMGAGMRYGWFDPSGDINDNEQHAITAFINAPLNNGVQFIAEYQNKSVKQGSLPDINMNNFQIRLIVIW
jgi:hypothetical protein